jgi:hypothetical protein
VWLAIINAYIVPCRDFESCQNVSFYGDSSR